MAKAYIASWEAPSNIALIKYWGKYGQQLPANASLSFSLSACTTHTKVTAEEIPFKDFPDIRFLFEGEERPNFLPKIEAFFRAILPECPWLKKLKITIESSNTFPHSSGIASSASAFAALALCITEIEEQITGKKNAGFFRAASHRARLGSGSAARSVYGNYTVWGKHPIVAGSHQEYAVPISDTFSEEFQDLLDYVLLIDQGEKSVSSTAGHSLMHNHPYAQARFASAPENLHQLMVAMRSGDVNEFFEIIEQEALGLHALMMSSRPNYILMRPNTLAAIEHIRNIRRHEGLPIGFTLDAGANVHLIAPKSIEHSLNDFVNTKLKPLCSDEVYICDRIGKGPKNRID
jgi:diphosphomevalonate decarboxylase